MAARPPQNDITDESDAGEFGIVAVDGAMDTWDISFPTSTDELARQYGDESIPVDPAGHEIAFETALTDCQKDRFEHKQELLNALHPIFEEKRERLSNSLFGRLKTLVPF
ncbi:hypothetical protein ACFQJ7_13725 [Halovenus rubra]|uniref:Uncharacterized protein n=2 Tax=Halovenus rubra TaxID=869890 RepID=A0ACC7DYD2_9EURY|nr:hypothetical protein [Halovenus rubra]